MTQLWTLTVMSPDQAEPHTTVHKTGTEALLSLRENYDAENEYEGMDIVSMLTQDQGMTIDIDIHVDPNDIVLTDMEQDSLWTLLGEGPDNLSEDERNALGVLLNRLEGVEGKTSGWIMGRTR